MDLDVPVDSQQLESVAPLSTSQPSGVKEGGKDPERFYCPYPGCNRSFAELWRLKVHFRAPPDIRGSGKERGHGTELTHCPKCGKTLKPGKHHVGCSGSKTNARQVNKRCRAAGEADPPDEALATSQPSRQGKGELEGEPHQSSWQDYTRSQALHPLTLQPALKQEQQEWPSAIQPGIMYAPNGTATACWLPSQVNGFVPQLAAHGFPQAQFPTELQFPAGVHGYPHQVPGFHGLAGYPPQGLQGVPAPGQLLSVQPSGTLQHIATGLHPSVVFHQTTHDGSLLGSHTMPPSIDPQTTQPTSAATAGQPQLQPLLPSLVSTAGQASAAAGVQQVPSLDTSNDGQQSQAGPPNHNQHQPHLLQQLPGQQPLANGTASCSGELQPQYLQLPMQPQQQAKPAESNGSLGSVFADEVEEFTRDFGRIPSPPPLPVDFHAATSSHGNGVLFNFSQFNQRLPRSQSHTRLDRNLSAVGLSMEQGLGDGDLLYDHSDDGDIMQLLFGVPDELPTMATIHLHKWSNEDEEDDDDHGLGSSGSGAGARGAPVPTAPAPPSVLGPEAAARNGSPGMDLDQVMVSALPLGQAPQDHSPIIGAQSHGSPGPHAMLNSTGSPDTCTAAEVPQLQEVEDPGRQMLVSGINMKKEPCILPAHGPSGGGGKVALAHLMNGLSGGHHAAEEHHRDHMLDAETCRLLQSCD